jgi:hypothetical protein
MTNQFNSGVVMRSAKSRVSKMALGLVYAVAIPVALVLSTGAASAVPTFFNGFETDTAGWSGPISRVASGTGGVTSAEGAWHAETVAGSFTQWGGYENAFPTNGYSTEVDIYLDMAKNTAAGTDDRFDYSSAINNTAGTHRRDFVFSVGTNPAAAGQFVMSASNNAPGWPGNPGRDPFTVSETGWYTFRHTFQNNGGVLAVEMDVLDDDGVVLHSWTLSDASDVIGTTVGGNRYGWFVTSDFSALAVDNSRKVNAPVSPATEADCKNGGWVDFVDENDEPFTNQGQCVSWANHHDDRGQDDN